MGFRHRVAPGLGNDRTGMVGRRVKVGARRQADIGDGHTPEPDRGVGDGKAVGEVVGVHARVAREAQDTVVERAQPAFKVVVYLDAEQVSPLDELTLEAEVAAAVVEYHTKGF